MAFSHRPRLGHNVSCGCTGIVGYNVTRYCFSRNLRPLRALTRAGYHTLYIYARAQPEGPFCWIERFFVYAFPVFVAIDSTFKDMH